SNAEVVKYAGINAYVRKNLGRAEDLLVAASALAPDDPEGLLYLMRTLYATGSEERALPVAERLLASDGGNTEALRVIARVRGKQGDAEGALSHWHLLFDAAPKDHEAALQIARIASRLEDHATADQFAGAMLKIDPNRAEAMQLRIAALMKLGEQ